MDQWKKDYLIGLVTWPLAILLFIMLLSFSNIAKSEELEVITGGITEHLISIPEAKAYRTILGDGGNLIYNPMLGIRYETSERGVYQAFTAFGGDNSIGRPMFGGLYETGLKASYTELGMVMGGYEQQHQVWTDNNIQTLHMLQVGDTEFMPVIGLNLSFKYAMDNGWFLAEHNILAFDIFNMTIGFGRSF